MAILASKPTVNVNAGFVNPTYAYDGSGGGDMTTFSSGSSVGAAVELTLSSFSNPAGFTPGTLKIIAKPYLVNKAMLEEYGGSVSIDASTDGGGSWSSLMYIDALSTDGLGEVRTYQMDVAGEDITQIQVRGIAIGSGLDDSTASLRIYDCWVEGTVPGGGFSGIPCMMGF